MTILESYIVPDHLDEPRLSDYACVAFEKIIPSKKGIKKAIKRGCILVDGQVGDTGWKLKSGQRLELLSDYSKIPKIYELDLEVLYEDEKVAVVHKPAGLITSGNEFRTLYNALGFNLQKSKLPDALPYPTPCHRLDKSTSGCVIVAKTKSAQIDIGKQFSKKNIKKTYFSIVHGELPPKGRIDSLINGQEAVTTYKTIQQIKSKSEEIFTIVEMYPLTGRTHQLRIHFSKIGHPILGDKLYGKPGNIFLHKGLFLCAVSIKFKLDLEEVTTNTTVPAKFQRFVKLLAH